jgi:hypothetical protein
MNLRGVLDNPVTKQRPVLHQSKHTNVPPDGANRLPQVFTELP